MENLSLSNLKADSEKWISENPQLRKIQNTTERGKLTPFIDVMSEMRSRGVSLAKISEFLQCYGVTATKAGISQSVLRNSKK